MALKGIAHAQRGEVKRPDVGPEQIDAVRDVHIVVRGEEGAILEG
jgi:hypothetical protein